MGDDKQNITELSNQTEAVEGISKGLEDVRENKTMPLEKFKQRLSEIFLGV